MLDGFVGVEAGMIDMLAKVIPVGRIVVIPFLTKVRSWVETTVAAEYETRESDADPMVLNGLSDNDGRE